MSRAALLQTASVCVSHYHTMKNIPPSLINSQITSNSREISSRKKDASDTQRRLERCKRGEKKNQSGLCDLRSLSGWKLALLKTVSAFFKWNIYTSIKITCTLSSCAQTAANINGPNSVCKYGTKLRWQSQTPCSYMHEGMAQNPNNKNPTIYMHPCFTDSGLIACTHWTIT